MTRPGYDESRCKAAAEHIARRIVHPLIRKYWKSDSLRISVKENETVVTEADRAIEIAIRAYLEQEFPGYGLIGEELGAQGSDRPYVWTIDPIDGTEAFVSGVPLFGTLLAVIEQSDSARRPVFGALYLPVQDQLVLGNRTETTIDGRPVRMRKTTVAREKRLLVGDLAVIATRIPAPQREKVWRLASLYRCAQTWGDCFGYVSMLKGTADVRIEAGLGVDDIAPIEPILLGAGGVATSWDGRSLSEVITGLAELGDASASFDVVSAASSELHEEAMSVILAR